MLRFFLALLLVTAIVLGIYGVATLELFPIAAGLVIALAGCVVIAIRWAVVNYLWSPADQDARFDEMVRRSRGEP